MRITAIKPFSNISFQGQRQKFNPNYINTDRMRDSFIKMAEIDTGSTENTEEVPSSAGQKKLAILLAKELKKIGLTCVEIDENGFVYGTLKGNIGANSPHVGLLAHMDTSSSAPTGPVHAIIHKYKKGGIKLQDNITIPENDLKNYKNQTIITSDGTTLLGADDKAGIAEIIEALRVFVEHPELKRPTLKIAFTPDEETGAGIGHINLNKLNADFAYTVDGNLPDHLYTETFNSYIPEITIEGFSIHLGHAYGKLTNSIKVANEIISKLPKEEAPETTKERVGYYHVGSINGNVEKTVIKMRVADFDDKKAQEKLKYLKKIVNEAQKLHPKAKITLKIRKFYGNMKDGIDNFREGADFALEGIRRTGYKPVEAYSRGGTDGSDLTEMGLPTPNLGAGSVNYHSRKEFVSLDVMKKCCENIINTSLIWAENSKKIIQKLKNRETRPSEG